MPRRPGTSAEVATTSHGGVVDPDSETSPFLHETVAGLSEGRDPGHLASRPLPTRGSPVTNPFSGSPLDLDPDVRATPGYEALERRAAEGNPWALEALSDLHRWLRLRPL